MGQYIVVLSTCPDDALARSLASALVDNSLAACVNILPRLTSVYSWQGKREMDDEVLMIIKTRQSLYKDVENYILEHHSYDVPEVIALPLTNGSASYLDWIDNQTRSPSVTKTN